MPKQRISGAMRRAAGAVGTYYVWRNAGDWWWHFKHDNGDLMGGGLQGYSKRSDCLHCIDVLKGSENCAVVILKKPPRD